MNILTFSWRGQGHPSAGGAEISTHEHAKRWVREGNEVTLFTSFFPGAKKEEIVDGVKIIRRGCQLLGVHLTALKWYLFDDHDNFDLVIDQFHGIPFFTPIFVRVKKLGFIHEVTKEVWKLNPWPKPFNLIPALLGTIIEPLIFKLIYKNIPFMTVSKSTKDDLINWGIDKDKITVVYNGLDRPNIKIPKKENVKTIVFLGVLTKDKGIEQALEVFSGLKKIYKNNIRFWVIGKGNPDYEVFLRQKAKKIGLPKVKFWGYVSNKKKLNLLAKAHILVNTSIREGWGLVVLEAASVGTPAVAFNVVGLKDSIQHGKTGLLSEYSTADFVKNVWLLLRDEDKYRSFRENAIFWSKKFSWEKSAGESLSLLNAL